MRRILIVGWLLFLLSACASIQQAPSEASAVDPVGGAIPPQGQNHAKDTEAPEEAQSQADQAVVPVQNWSSAGDNPEIQLIDLFTGEKLKVFPKLEATALTLAADGKKLAAIESNGESCEGFAGGTACRRNAYVLHLVSLPEWQGVTVDLSSDGWVSTAAFSSDATRLALSLIENEKSSLVLFDAVKGVRLARIDVEFRPELIRFNPQGTELLVYGQAPGTQPGDSKPAEPQVLLVDIPALHVLWQQALDGVISGEWCDNNCMSSHGERVQAYWRPAVVYAPERQALYVVHADEERLTTVDLKEQQVRTVEIGKAKSFLERVLELTADIAKAKGPMNGSFKEAVLSPDGRALYIVGRKINAALEQDGSLSYDERSSGLQIVDPKTGKLIERRDSQASGIRLSPDGAYLFLIGTTGGTGWTEVISTGDRKSIAKLSGWEIVITHGVDGQVAYVGLRYDTPRSQLAVLDPNTFQIMKSWSPSGEIQWIWTSP